MEAKRPGWVEVVCGCMFSGKTETLIHRLRRVVLAKQRVLLVKPAIDDRYSEADVVSHSSFRMEAVPIKGGDGWEIVKEWLAHDQPPVVGIDEGQFFKDLPQVAVRLASSGVRVVVAGLDQDYQGKPFLDPELLSLADDVVKVKAVCMTCGNPATKTQRLSESTDLVQVGAAGQYEARCRACWTG